MPWTPAACGTTAEFVELLNFGPGPVNIGCYILTDGDYSITIPANTILQPGDFYVISGMDSIPYPCANIDSAIHTDLNWNTCNCTSAPIPTTGDGFLTDGGSANEQVVLLDPFLNVIDAVVRSLPVESSSLISSSTAGGNCLPRVFDLDLLTINYETIGESAGRGNSFARRLDGDCGWVKDPQQSGNATNNTPGDVSDVTYSFQYIQSTACPDNGSILVTVHASSYGNVFPMSYTLAFDTDKDGIFETTDSYTNGTVTNPNTISISNLVPGMYRLTVASVKGCYLHTFPFIIIDCEDALALQLLSFTAYKKREEVSCNWVIAQAGQLRDVTVERSTDGVQFQVLATITAPSVPAGQEWYYSYKTRDGSSLPAYYRLLLRDKQGAEQRSGVLRAGGPEPGAITAWPNPARDFLYVNTAADPGSFGLAEIYNSSGHLVLRENRGVSGTMGIREIGIRRLTAGIYQLVLRTTDGENPRYFRFVKL